jgi:hypothetical protein
VFADDWGKMMREAEDADLSEDVPKQPEVGSKNSTWITVMITVVIAVLTSLIAPYLLESHKEKQALHDKEAEKHERIVSTQFEIVEACSETYWKYRQAADFVVFDFEFGQPDGPLWERHWSDFQRVAAEANSQLPIQAFRGRMYFGSTEVYQRLLNIPRTIFSAGGVDRDITRQFAKDRLPNAGNGKSADAWGKIHRKLDDANSVADENLNYAFRQIGVNTNSNVDEFKAAPAPQTKPAER